MLNFLEFFFSKWKKRVGKSVKGIIEISRLFYIYQNEKSKIN
jgi:hypothetical protein